MDKPSVIPFVPRFEKNEKNGSGRAGDGRRRKAISAARLRTFGDRLSDRTGQALKVIRWPLILFAAGFLFGRAVMLGGLAPFAAAFFAVALHTRREWTVWVALAVIAGSFWSAQPEPLVIFAELAIIYLLHRGLEAYARADLTYAPVVAFSAVLMVRLFDAITNRPDEWLPYALAALEAGLALALTLLLAHALPLLMPQRRERRLFHEEWIGVVILAASLVTGLAGWSVYGVDLALAAALYVVLLFAMTGGPALGTAAGVVAGIVLTLSDLEAAARIGMLAFGGLMAGLLRPAGKWAAIFGLMLGTAVLAIYENNPPATMDAVRTALAASALLLVTPRAMLGRLARIVPGTTDYARRQQEYAQKVRDLTAERVERFAAVFRQLSRAFRQMTQAGDAVRETETVDHIAHEVHDRVCAGCPRKQLCWDKQFTRTYQLLSEMTGKLEENPAFSDVHIPPAWSRQCIKVTQVLDEVRRRYDLYRFHQQWRRQLKDNSLLVADQLSGVSRVMDDLVREIRREGQAMGRQEEQIREALDSLGLAIYSVDVISLEEGNVEIEIVHSFRPGFDEARKLIAPLLSGILGETVTVRSERTGEPAKHLTTVVFASAKSYEVETGVASAAKDGGLLSGDCFTTIELGSGKFAVALSDGMGNGARAWMESSAALTMLEQLLKSGIDERLAVKSVNSVLLLRSPDEMFATIDLALIDLHSAQANLLKIGSMPSFIKRGREVLPVSANNLPAGILHDIEFDQLQIQLMPGDTLVMVTDGVMDAASHTVNKEQWMKRLLLDLDTDNPQELAERLLDAAMRQSGGTIRDDMTVVVARITKYQPEWAALRWPGVSRLERPKTVS